MKLSIVSGLNESLIGIQKDTEEIKSLCKFLKPLGYNGIELSLLRPEIHDAKKIMEIVDSYDMEVSALGTGSTFIRCGYSLGHVNEQLRQKAIERLIKYMDFAIETESLVIIGLIRGRYNYDSSLKKERLNIISSLKKCVNLAEDRDVELVFEPINQFEIDSYNTIASSLELIKELNSDNIKLLIDTFHTHLEEDPGFVWDYLDDIASHISHLHLADTTRRAPGTGHFDFRTFLNIFKNHNYNGYASIETIMKPSFEDVAKESAGYLQTIIGD
jgi:sugar phosphate isomerase/epimerase